jgi:hypothetical protein
MNWFTRGAIVGDAAYKTKLLNEDGGCEHVEKDINLAAVLRREMDSFGPVSSYVCCQACDTKALEEEDNEECVCRDCGMTVKKKDGIEWRWYDFYAPQGDEALFICNACKVLPKHQNRVARDDQDRRDEDGDAFSDDGMGNIDDQDDAPECDWECSCCHGNIGPEDEGHHHDEYPWNICTPCHTKRA